jgi:hypothetical protein
MTFKLVNEQSFLLAIKTINFLGRNSISLKPRTVRETIKKVKKGAKMSNKEE